MDVKIIIVLGTCIIAQNTHVWLNEYNILYFIILQSLNHNKTNVGTYTYYYIVGTILYISIININISPLLIGDISLFD